MSLVWVINMVSDYFDCRLAIQDYLAGTWLDYRVLKCKTFTYNTKNEVKVIQPMMLRVFSGTFEAAFGIVSGKMSYAKGNPAIIVDFAQWTNTFNLNCFHSRSDKKMYQTMSEVNNLFTWIKNHQNTVIYRVYLQMFINDADMSHKPNCALDPANTMFGALEGYGYMGEVTNLDITGQDAGKGSVDFTLNFQHGLVVPI